MKTRVVPALACVAALALASAADAQLVRSGTGDLGAGAAVDAFRLDLGGVNNGVTPGSQGGGRREISWDGGGAAAPPAFFGTPMTNFANRGSVFTTPGPGFEISGQPFERFGDLNPTYPTIFQTFSDPRLFAPLGSNVLDVIFTIPGSTTDTALTRGFGAIFTDVDLSGQTSLEFLDASGGSLGTFFVPALDEGLSFLGVSFVEAIVSRVRITLGDTALGPNDSSLADVVALDDFIYGEPVAQVDEPATLALIAIATLLALRRKA
jgi:hypothetical protein